jgi:DNA-directed RNA polymerase specialized sigma24 family protein
MIAQLILQCLVANGVLNAEELSLLRRLTVEGESVAEVAEDLGTSPAALRKRKQRLLEKLRRSLRDS